jgi:ABC-type sugar transport system ATPase subunit
MMKTVIADITEQLKITTILVSHEPADILPWASQLMLLKDGQVIQQGKPKDVYRCPVDQYCAGLLGAYNMLSAKEAQRLSGAEKTLWKNASVMIRPEDLHVSDGGEEMTIVRYEFMGAQHLYQLDWQGKRMMMLMETDLYAVGEKIGVSASLSSIWSFPADN